MSRNRILKPNDGWQYIKAGIIKPEFKTSINNVKIQTDPTWCHTLLRQLEHYRKTAPYFDKVHALLSQIFSDNYITLVDLNRKSLEKVLCYLGMNCKLVNFSDLHVDTGTIEHPGQWALRISEAIDAKEYVNLSGGIDIFEKDEFSKSNITLTFIQHLLPEYYQGRKTFEPGLSIIDVLMFNSVEKIHEMIAQYKTL